MNMKRKVLIEILIAISVVCVALIGVYFWKKQENANIYERMQKRVEETENAQEKRNESPTEEDGVTIPIDFEWLRETNEDIYAWIQIEGTNVDYPIVQDAENDEYYLMHTVDGQKGYPGAIYTERCNSKDFTDFNTLIYGHDMRDGSMFQNLHNYSDRAYMAEHPEIVIYTPEKKLTYRIFAAVVYDDRHIMNSYNFTDVLSRQAYLDSIFSIRDMSSVIDDSVHVTTESRIITLSTCIGSQPDNRFLVEAVLQNEEEK